MISIATHTIDINDELGFSGRRLSAVERVILSTLKGRLSEDEVKLGIDIGNMTEDEIIKYVWSPFKDKFIQGLKAHFPSIDSDITTFVEELNLESPNNSRENVLQFTRKLQEKLGIDDDWNYI